MRVMRVMRARVMTRAYMVTLSLHLIAPRWPCGAHGHTGRTSTQIVALRSSGCAY